MSEPATDSGTPGKPSAAANVPEQNTNEPKQLTDEETRNVLDGASGYGIPIQTRSHPKNQISKSEVRSKNVQPNTPSRPPQETNDPPTMDTERRQSSS